MKNKRTLTVGEYISRNYCAEQYSRILIQGMWLKDLGFVVGKKVSVQIANINDKVELYISLVD